MFGESERDLIKCDTKKPDLKEVRFFIAKLNFKFFIYKYTCRPLTHLHIRSQVVL